MTAKKEEEFKKQNIDFYHKLKLTQVEFRFHSNKEYTKKVCKQTYNHFSKDRYMQFYSNYVLGKNLFERDLMEKLDQDIEKEIEKCGKDKKAIRKWKQL